MDSDLTLPFSTKTVTIYLKYLQKRITLYIQFNLFTDPKKKVQLKSDKKV